MLLKTQRLALRPHALTDVAFMLELNSDPEVVRYTGNVPFESEDEARLVIEQLMLQYRERRMGRFVVEDLNTGEKLGWCGLKWHPDKGVADLGYRFHKRHWGKGYATEAGRACLSYGFDELKLPRIVADAEPENLASIHVLEKLGFIQTGPTTCEGRLALGFLLLRP